MSDLENFINNLKASGKTEIGSSDESKNLSKQQIEIICGFLLRESIFKDKEESGYSNEEVMFPAELMANYMIYQEEKIGMDFSNHVKKGVVDFFIDKVDGLLKRKIQ